MSSNLLPDIDQYLESIDNNLPISVSNLIEIIESISANTGLKKETSEIILRLFFQEIRNCLLNKQVVSIRKLGSFLISSPVITKNSKKIFPKFKAKKSLIRNINEK